MIAGRWWSRGGTGPLWTALAVAVFVAACGTGGRSGEGGIATVETGGAVAGTEHADTVSAARLIFVGDTGTGDDRARGVAARIRRQAAATFVSHVFLLGDNVYEHGSAQSIEPRFLDVYGSLVTDGVKMHAALGNHDVWRCRDSGLRPVGRDRFAYRRSPGCDVESHLATPEFGYVDRLRYYAVGIGVRSPGGRVGAGADRAADPPLVEVFVLDSNTLGNDDTKLTQGQDAPQLRWLAEALRSSSARWKIVAMHHPVYTPARCLWLRFACRGEDRALRDELEPIFREHGVDAVFQAHQHFYARLRPQHGIRYFVTGAGGKEADSFREDERTVPRDDRGAFNHFVYVHATEHRFGYCVIDANGGVRDAGSFGHGDAMDAVLSHCPSGR